MIEGKAILVVDLGNSETRVMTMFGKGEDGEPVKGFSVLPNNFAVLNGSEPNLLENKDYDASNSRVFEVVDSKTGKEFKVCSGRMCDIEKEVSSTRPSAINKKYEAVVSMYTMRLAFLEGYYHIARMFNTGLDKINVSWSVTVLLPPDDLEDGVDKIKNSIMSLKSINFLMPKLHKKLEIEDIKVFPEGFCAFIGTLFESKRKIRDGYASYLKKSVLVIDIGAGTTDLCIIKDTKLVDTSRQSLDIGGNLIVDKLKKSLKSQFSRFLHDNIVREAVVSGFLNIGAKQFDVREKINISKKEVASRLSGAIRSYIEGSDFNVVDVDNILICGGGAEECAEGIDTLASLLMDDLATWLPYSDMLEIPSEKVSVIKNDVTYFEERGISPRLLNILGAGVLSE